MSLGYKRMKELLERATYIVGSEDEEEFAKLLVLLATSNTDSVEYSHSMNKGEFPPAKVTLNIFGPEAFLAGKLMKPRFWSDLVQAIIEISSEKVVLEEENRVLLEKLSMYSELEVEANKVWPGEDVQEELDEKLLVDSSLEDFPNLETLKWLDLPGGKAAICPFCEGSGGGFRDREGPFVTCELCKGAGALIKPDHGVANGYTLADPSRVNVPLCPLCGGDQEIEGTHGRPEDCPRCDGVGCVITVKGGQI